MHFIVFHIPLIFKSVAGGVGKSALTGMYDSRSLLANNICSFQVRFIRDVFVETYDPTIEGTRPVAIA